MGGRPPEKREVDRRNQKWLDAKQDFLYRRSTKGTDVRPEHVEVLGVKFIRVPFPGKNQTVWGFETYEDLERFKQWLIERSSPTPTPS